MPQYVPTSHTYSSAVKAGDTVFIGLHRGGGEDFETQFRKTFAALERTLAKLDCALAQVVKVNVYLKRIEDLPEMEKLFADYFPAGSFPARMTSTTEFIDGDCLMMIDGVAYCGD